MHCKSVLLKWGFEMMYFENSRVKIEVSSDSSKVISVLDKKSSKDIKGEDTYLFSLVGADKESVFVPCGMEVDGNTVTVKTQLGDFAVEVLTEDDYFTFELKSELPKDAYKLVMSNIKYAYDPSDKANTGAAGVAMTYWVNPCFFPDG